MRRHFLNSGRRNGRPGPAARASGFLALAAACLALAAGCTKGDAEGKPQAPPKAAPVPVTVEKAVRQTIPVTVRTFGWVEAYSTVAVKSQITGVLTKVHFAEGQRIKQGALLFSIDPRPLQAALEQAEAVLARDKTLHANAQKEVERQTELLRKGFTAQDTYDLAKTAAETLDAAIRADQAAIENAKVQLEYCSIPSPIEGRAGSLMVHEGNLVKAQDITLVTINQIRPIKVTFAVTQKELPEIQRQMAKGKLEVRAFVPGDKQRPETGELAFVDNTVDAGTGMIHLKGVFVNAEERLWPGLFVTVALTVREQPDVVVIPARAIETGQKGQHVFVVKPDGTVETRPVTVDRKFDAKAVILSGVQPDETVVTDGQLRLVPGAKVAIKPAAEAGGEPRP